MRKLKDIHWMLICVGFGVLGFLSMVLDIKVQNPSKFLEILFSSGIALGALFGFIAGIFGIIKSSK